MGISVAAHIFETLQNTFCCLDSQGLVEGVSPDPLSKMSILDHNPGTFCFHGFWNATKERTDMMESVTITLGLTDTAARLIASFWAFCTIFVGVYGQDLENASI